ncbi:proline dehydrogenase 1, mitochondrial-like [Oppia nitens]|uniref:proline dehydrogenase 1, mitochondrial-like n=1 Tax=Oppia nitens TaxID=1686743 RepID=UPI0023DBA329|nr:proline dehydrogenase 1, mitochondrial-like [Oppia nitens]
MAYRMCFITTTTTIAKNRMSCCCLVNRLVTINSSVNNNKSRRHVSTTTTTNSTGRSSHQSATTGLNFDNTREAFKSKTTSQLLRALIVLKLCQYDVLVNNHTKLIKIGRKVLGDSLFKWLLKNSFYGHFVAGEDEQTIRPTLDHLRSFGVKSILDYSAEEDITEEEAIHHEMPDQTTNSNHQQSKDESLKQFSPQKEFADRRKYRPVARTYFYMNEANCEKNMTTFLRCIDAVAGATHGTGFAAIKLTALGRPVLLSQLSEVIVRTRKYFTEITGVEKMVRGHISPEQFQHDLDHRFNIDTDNEEIKSWLKQMDYDRRGLMNLFSWNGLIDMQHLISDLFRVPNLTTGLVEPIIRALTAEEEEMFRNMMRRIHTIASTARDRDVRVLIDAEQTYFQPAINRITMELMRKYNKQKAIIFNTYQCYLKSAHECCVVDLELAQRQNFYFGAKLVRGAYLEQERHRAQVIGYDDPINDTYQLTTDMYHKNLEFFMNKIIETGIDNKKIAIMVATHNEDTVRYTLKKMKELEIEPNHRVICFGQLYGMCDQISFSLGQSGYSVYKYVPYGPVDEVIPYLSRRAIENHGIIKNAKKERQLLARELVRRLKCGHLFYKPIGNYTPI